MLGQNLIEPWSDHILPGFLLGWHNEQKRTLPISTSRRPALGRDVRPTRRAGQRALGAKRVRSFVAEEHEIGDLVAGRGYRQIRSSWTMEIEFGVEAPPEPVIPDGIRRSGRTANPEDEQACLRRVQEAFPRHWDFRPSTLENWREFNVKARNFEPDLGVVGWDGEEVAGASLNYPERSGDPRPRWVGTLGVRRDWRPPRGRRSAACAARSSCCNARGLRKVRLGVDADEPPPARRGCTSARACACLRQSNTWERELVDAGSTGSGN